MWILYAALILAGVIVISYYVGKLLRPTVMKLEGKVKDKPDTKIWLTLKLTLAGLLLLSSLAAFVLMILGAPITLLLQLAWGGLGVWILSHRVRIYRQSPTKKESPGLKTE